MRESLATSLLYRFLAVRLIAWALHLCHLWEMSYGAEKFVARCTKRSHLFIGTTCLKQSVFYLQRPAKSITCVDIATMGMFNLMFR